jgi:hypothetical protein
MDVLKDDNWRRRRAVPEVDAEPDLVVEDADSGFCGAVVGWEFGAVVLEDRHGKRRNFPLAPAAFLLDGQPVTLRRPAARPVRQRRVTASGSIAVEGHTARVARSSRIWVEGIHDAALVERIWGHDLRVEGVVVEPLSGIDDLAAAVAEFRPDASSRLGVLVDHLVPGSKESRIVAAVTSPYVMVTGHPYIDIWQAVKPARVGIAAWPVIPRSSALPRALGPGKNTPSAERLRRQAETSLPRALGPGKNTPSAERLRRQPQSWKEGVCKALGVAEPADMWRRILGSVSSFRDVETPLIGAMERLIDFVTAPGTD